MTRGDRRELDDGGHIECDTCKATFTTWAKADRHVIGEHGGGILRFHDGKEQT